MSDFGIGLHSLDFRRGSLYSAVSSVHESDNAGKNDPSLSGQGPRVSQTFVDIEDHVSDERHADSLKYGHNRRTPRIPTSRLLTSTLMWWIPELVASALSITSFCAIVGILYKFNGRLAADLHLPRFLTLNGLVAAIATVNRACLTTPVCSAMMQEMWIYFSDEASRTPCRSRLQDLEIFTEASNSAIGSIKFLAHARGRRYVAIHPMLSTVLTG